MSENNEGIRISLCGSQVRITLVGDGILGEDSIMLSPRKAIHAAWTLLKYAIRAELAIHRKTRMST
jgi:hypothetical protein